jgi:hypothetical protein
MRLCVPGGPVGTTQRLHAQGRMGDQTVKPSVLYSPCFRAARGLVAKLVWHVGTVYRSPLLSRQSVRLENW